MNLVFLALNLLDVSFLQAEPPIFRSGDELIMRIDNLAQLRLQHDRLSATVRLKGTGGERRWVVDLMDRVQPNALVIDLSGYGDAAAASFSIEAAPGKIVGSHSVQPVPRLEALQHRGLAADSCAAIERGVTWSGDLPKIPLPDLPRLRPVDLQPPARSVNSSDITYPVITNADMPGVSSMNAVLVSRQTFAPADPSRCSLYFSYRKSLFDQKSGQLAGYRKLLVEVPLDRRWLEGSGDATIILPPDGFAIHTTDELERYGNRWDAPMGYNILGESSTGLFQGGQTADIDEKGRIYISNVPDGAGLIRFNPHTAKFEQPPLNFHDAIKALLPADSEWKRGWDRDLGQIVCVRGRVYIVYDRNYRVITPNGKFETCSGVVSVPQDHWDEPEAFRRDIRLHAGSWAGARHPLYSTDVAVGLPRRAGSPIATETGIAFGNFRLDLDARGNTARLAMIKNLADTKAADGSILPPTRQALERGLPRQRLINVGGAGRAFLNYGYGECRMSRAALALTLPGGIAGNLADASGKHLTTYPNAPAGELTIRFDIVGKIRNEASRHSRLAASLVGLSQGPGYGITAIPGQPDAAIGVCEYSYYFSRLDFARRATDRKVYRSYLPLHGQDRSGEFPIPLGLGPYGTNWIEHGGATWLYTAGYTGMGRLKFAENGKSLTSFTQELFHRRLSPRPVDGRQRDAVKDFLHVIPSLDGRLIDIGRGRPGRGGGAYSAGLELFDPVKLGDSQTAVVMNRCYGLYTPVSRVVMSAAGKPARQEIFCATGEIRPEYVADLKDPTERPVNQDPKLMSYDVTSGGSLRDRFGFALPRNLAGGSDATIAFSPCRQYIVALQSGGHVHTYSVAQRRFVDGVLLRRSSGASFKMLGFSRPSETLWTAPDGQMFFSAMLDEAKSRVVAFYRVSVSAAGRIEIQPHLTVRLNGTGKEEPFDDIARALLPDLKRMDGSYDLVLGGDTANGGQSSVRVIDDFILPRMR
ncbi:MAG: hypothetical protein ACKO26_12675 [Planctomycetota bacterium]